MNLLLALVCVLLISTHIRADPPPTPHYTITDLGIEPQWNPQAYRKNSGVMLNGVLLRVGSQGQVRGAVRRYPSGKPPYHMFFSWSKNRLHFLGRLPVIASRRHQLLFDVNDMNSFGEAVVTRGIDYENNAADLTYLYHARAYLWRSGHLHSLGTVPGSDDAEGKGINETGDIVCVSQNDIFSSFAFIWHKGKRQRLSLPVSYPFISGLKINKRGDIAGTVTHLEDAETNQSQAVLYRQAKLQPVPPIPGCLTAFILALNGNGDFLALAQENFSGEGYPPIVEHNFLWSMGSWQVIRPNNRGVLGDMYGQMLNTVTAMNASDAVVGLYGRYRDPDQRAFVYNEGTGQMQDLNTLIPASSDWKLIKACDINDAGQIVGYGKHHGKDGLFLLTPVHQAKP